MGRWHKGCIINQVWDSVVDPNDGLVYICTNGQVLRLHQQRRRQRYQYRYVRIQSGRVRDRP
jgi:hypothetical protein